MQEEPLMGEVLPHGGPPRLLLPMGEEHIALELARL